MRLGTGLALVATGLATLAPCTLGLSAGLGGLVATIGLIVASRESRSTLLPVLALLANLGAFVISVLLALLALFLGVVAVVTAAVAGAEASIDVAREVPHAVRVLRGALSPAGFWIAYHPDELVSHDASDGPWGGWLDLHWRARKGERFDADEVLAFATENGWVLHGSEQVGAGDKRHREPSCLLPSEECCPSIDHAPVWDPRAFRNLLPTSLHADRTREYTLMSFASGWMDSVDVEPPGTTVNGFVILSNDGRDLVVHHEWGD